MESSIALGLLILGLILAVAWLLMPFLLLDALRKQRFLTEATNRQIEKLSALLAVVSGQLDRQDARKEAWLARSDELLQAVEKNTRKASSDSSADSSSHPPPRSD